MEKNGEVNEVLTWTKDNISLSVNFLFISGFSNDFGKAQMSWKQPTKAALFL